MAKIIKPCTIYLVRHGESDWNVKNLMQGETSGVPLTKKGISQARAIAKQFQQVDFAAIFASDLLRARQTAQIIAFRRRLAVTTSRAIRERSFGEFEGKTLECYQKKLKQVLDKFYRLDDKEKFAFKFPYRIEGIEATVSRTITFLREISLAYPGKKVLVVTHGGILRLLLIHLGYASYNQLPPFSIDNGGYAIIASDGLEFKIKQTVGINKHEG
jgi:broad specificity phosphatase PhoE